MEEQPEVITPEEAEDILRPEVEKMLDDDWRIVSKPLYGVRLQRGDEICDMRVDLLGNVEREIKAPVISNVDQGRMIAWMLLITSLLVTLAVASALGLLD